MPGYLSNRVISLMPATESELAAAQAGIQVVTDALDGRLDTAESNIVSLDSRLDSAEPAITSLTNRITAAEGDIEDLQLNVGV